MIRAILITALLAFGAIAWAAGDENAIEGIWETDTGGYVQIHKEGDAWVGTVVGSRSGEARYDTENPDEKLRGRRLLGVTVLKGLEYAGDNEWDDGSIYSPDNGKTYSARATLTDENTLEARGYLGISLLGRSQTWQRVDRDAPNLETDLLK